MLIFIPLAGVLSDKIGRKIVLLIAALGIAILSYPLFWLMHHQSIIMIWSGQFGFAILVSLFSGGQHRCYGRNGASESESNNCICRI